MSVRSERFALFGILLAAAALRVWFVSVSAPTDDAYITFRYARNLAAGLGFVYNPGERVLGTTTPLFTLLLSPFALLRLPLETAARSVAVLADLGTLLILYRLVRVRGGQEAALLSAAVYGLLYLAASACGYGMETQLFTFFVTAAVAAAMDGRRLAAGAAAGLAALTRPEGGILAGGICAVWLVRALLRKERFAWGGTAALIGLVLPWLLFATLYFGSPIPNSLLAKFRQEDIALARWGAFFFTRNILLIALWAGAALGAAVGFAQARGLAIPFVAWAIGYPLFFLLGRPPFLGVWYFPPVIPAVAGLFGIGGAWSAGRLIRKPALRQAVTAAAVCAAVAGGLPRNLESARWSRTLSEQVYRPMATWLSHRTAPGDLVQVSDIGYVGYFTSRRVLDSSALVSPEVARFYAARRADPFREARLVLAREPRVVILPVSREILDRYSQGGLMAAYRPVARFRVAGWGAIKELPRDMTPPRSGGRFEADFIAFERIGPSDPTDTSR